MKRVYPGGESIKEWEWISVEELEKRVRENRAKKSRCENLPKNLFVFYDYILSILLIIFAQIFFIIGSLILYDLISRYMKYGELSYILNIDFFMALLMPIGGIAAMAYVAYEFDRSLYAFTGHYYLYDHLLCFPMGDPDGKSFDRKKKRVTKYYCVPIRYVWTDFRKPKKSGDRIYVRMYFVEKVKGEMVKSFITIPKELAEEIAEWLREEGWPENVLGEPESDLDG